MNRRTLSVSVFALVFSAAAFAQTSNWQIDPAHSSAQFAVKHMMVSTVRGTFSKVSGSAQFDPAKPAATQLDATIDVSTVNTGNDSRDKDLRSPNFFDVDKFPAMTFKAKRVESAGSGKLKIIGDLTIHGVTKEVSLDVDGPSAPINDGRGQRMGASATTRSIARISD